MSTTRTASTARPESGRPASPLPPAPAPGDAERVPEPVLAGPGYSPQHERWQLVRIRLGGQWRLGLLTAWWQPPRTGRWAASVEWEGPGGRRAYGWFWHSAALQLLQVPQGPDPVPVPVAVASGGSFR